MQESNEGLLDKLRLIEGDYLKRAAALVFHPDPERFVTGAFIKIGYFKEDANLIFQDEVHGNLFQQVKATMELLTTKYLRALISYEGIQRIETLPIPKEALREALLNAVVHKAYESSTPIQIGVYDDRLEIWNCGTLPEDWTLSNLLGKHRSRPYNPDIANVFFRAGEIEAWGRGIERIIASCKKEGYPEPKFDYDGGGLWTVFEFKEEYVKTSGQISGQKGGQKGGQTTIEQVFTLIKNNPNITRKQIVEATDKASSFIQKCINKLKEEKRIQRIGSDRSGYWEITE